MPFTPDDYPGERIEDSILFISGTLTPSQNGEMAYVSGSGFRFQDEGTLKQLYTASLDANAHKVLNQLIHFIHDGPGDGFAISPFKETVGFPFTSRFTWYAQAAKTQRIFQVEITRSNGFLPVTESYKLYNPDGITNQIVATDVITYISGVFEIGRTRTFV